MNTEIRDVPVCQLVDSPFNTRKTRPDADVDRLADRMRRNGFERTRALWAVERSGAFEVFAGGTRLRAARAAELASVPVVVYVDASDEDVARLADVDNENDEYHRPVPIVDVWAEYARLSEAGWTQQRIADAKGCGVPMVSRRVGWHESLPPEARKATCDGTLDEGHLEAVSSLTCDVASFHNWLTTTQAQTELVAEVLGKHRGSTVGAKPTVATVREAAKRWKSFIRLAEQRYAELPAPYNAFFVDRLVEVKARSEAAVTTSHAAILERKAAADLRHEQERREALSFAEAQRVHAERAAAEAAARAARIAKIVLGDSRDFIAQAPSGIRLLLTDPPYGQAFQSGRRTTSAKKSAIANDETIGDAAALLADVLPKAFARMADDAHALIFTGWRFEPEIRAVIEAAGFTIKGSLVWVKNNHGTGDLEGSFAPKHERIIHAVKGKPKLVQRIPDVVLGKDKQNSDHPTEKPLDLLRALIEATTSPGDLVVDPFAGSGSTLFAADALGRDFWGCELDPTYHRKIADELAK